MRFNFLAIGASGLLFTIPGLAHDCSIGNTWDLLGEWTMMRRSLSQDRILAYNSATTAAALEANQQVSDFKYEPGFRLGVYYRPYESHSYELLFLDCGDWKSHKTVNANLTLSYPFDNTGYTHDYNTASQVQSTYKSQMWTGEFNYWKHVTPRFENYFSFSWLAGLRYMDLSENMDLAYSKPGYLSHYTVATKNRMPGGQVGVDLQYNPQERLSWDVLAKVGFFVDWAEQKTYLGDLNDTVTLRQFTVTKVKVPFFTEASASLAYQLNTHFNIHGGYQMLYVTGVALAPEQFSPKTTSNAGRKVDMSGQAIVHGWFLGLLFGF